MSMYIHGVAHSQLNLTSLLILLVITWWTQPLLTQTSVVFRCLQSNYHRNPGPPEVARAEKDI